MEANVSYERRRPSEPLAQQLLVALLPAITVAGVAGSLCGLRDASILLYWPVLAVVAGAVFAFRPRTG
jgi:hypothetical protein